MDLFADLAEKQDAAPRTAEPAREQAHRSQDISDGARLELDLFAAALQDRVRDSREFAYICPLTLFFLVTKYQCCFDDNRFEGRRTANARIFILFLK